MDDFQLRPLQLAGFRNPVTLARKGGETKGKQPTFQSRYLAAEQTDILPL